MIGGQTWTEGQLGDRSYNQSYPGACNGQKWKQGGGREAQGLAPKLA